MEYNRKEYEDLIRNILKDKDCLTPSLKEQAIGYQRGLNYLSKTKEEISSLPILIRELVLFRGCSCRRLAEIIYDEENDNHGVQFSGRDLKRWAAIELKELFEKQALILNEVGEGDFWHEY
jgi:hypothetical protein